MKYLLTFILALILCSSFLYYKEGLVNSSEPNKDSQVTIQIHNQAEEKNVTQFSSVSEQVEIENSDRIINDNDFYKYRMDTGYLSKEVVMQYESYPTDILLDMAKNNDIAAFQTLALRALLEGKYKRSQAKAYLEKAATLGSIHAVESLSTLAQGMYVETNDKKYALEALAYSEVAVRRGNILNQGYVELFNKTHGFNPTDTEISEILLKADQIITDIEHQRGLLGLPPLNNEPNPELVKLYNNKQSR